MSCNGANVKNTCGTKQYATCVYYEGDVPPFSSLEGDNCITIEDVAIDIYDILNNIYESFNFSSLIGSCITYPTTSPTLLEVLTAHQAKICQQEETISQMSQTIQTMQQQIDDLQTNNCP